MDQEDIKLLVDWFEQNKDHKLNFLEKEAVKMAVRKAETVGDLLVREWRRIGDARQIRDHERMPPR